jgi:hypothetical protein
MIDLPGRDAAHVKRVPNGPGDILDQLHHMTAYEGDPAARSRGWSCALVELRSDFENEGD